jgi:hypothetical protein
MQLKFVLAVLGLALFLAPAAQAQEEECSTPGWETYLLVSSLDNLGTFNQRCVVGSSTTGWDITLGLTLANQTSLPDMWRIAIEARVPNQVINSITVTATNPNPTAHPNDTISIIVRPGSGTIPLVRDFRKIAGTAHVAANVNEVGQIGTQSSPAVVRANSIGLLIARKEASLNYSGDIFADVETTPESVGTPLESLISLVRAQNNLFGIFKAARQVDTIEAFGQIGSSTDLVTIRSGTNGIGVVQATGHIYANIQCGPTGQQSIRRVQSVNAGFTGTLRASRFRSDFGSGLAGIRLASTAVLDADVDFAEDVISFAPGQFGNVAVALVAGSLPSY